MLIVLILVIPLLMLVVEEFLCQLMLQCTYNFIFMVSTLLLALTNSRLNGKDTVLLLVVMNS
jgi:hypothetical protein